MKIILSAENTAKKFNTHIGLVAWSGPFIKINV